VGDFFVTLAAADISIVTPIVHRVLVALIAEIKRSVMNTAVAAAVRVVVVLVHLESFKPETCLLVGVPWSR